MKNKGLEIIGGNKKKDNDQVGEIFHMRDENLYVRKIANKHSEASDRVTFFGP